MGQQSSGSISAWHAPHLTADLPGIGGTLKQLPEDFEVEEIPGYEPSGSGEHLFLWIEKRGVAAEELTRHVADSLGIAVREVGVAGLKDRHALTRQFVSVPRSAEDHIGRVETPAIRVLATRPHSHKLRTGHLKGNRFRIVVHDTLPDAVTRAEQIRQRLVAGGLPNFFGPQRFGRDGETAAWGIEMLRGQRVAPPGAPARQRFLRKLALSAGQAVLFNCYLARRMADGLLHTVLDGDVMLKQTGGIFYVTDRAAEQIRLDRRETIHAGPLFGKKVFAARAEAAAREGAVLAESGISPERFRCFGALLAGGRRANLLYLDELTISPVSGGLEFRFALPAGSYGTVLMAEFMKC
jgi:tRNA pseudouridine13 synthase